MSVQKRLFHILPLLLTLCAVPIIGTAQSDQPKPAEPNYEAVLHVVLSGAAAGQGDPLPDTLSAVSRAIRSEFGTGNLRLINTYYGRVSSMGSFDYKGVSTAYAPEVPPGGPSFLDWRLSGVRGLQNAAGQPVYYLQAFKFGARIPVKIGITQNDNAAAIVNYESIGLTVERVSVRENVPTLIGNLTQPRTEGTLFLVLTVRSADR